MKLRLILTVITFAISGLTLWGQQEPHFQHNYLNPFIYNPAYAGSNNQTEIGAFRNQRWANYNGGIISNLINVHSQINQSNSSIGLQLNTDNIGLTARTKAHLAYAYRIKLTEDFFIQPGFSVGIIDQRINYSGIVADFADPLLLQAFNPNSTGIDANFGIFMKYKEFRLGVSAPQLLGNRLSFTPENTFSYQLERQYIFNTSYTFFTNEKQNFFVQPDILVIHSQGLPLHYSASLLTGFKKIGWIGATYKSNYAVGANIGLSLRDQLKIGFAYDIPIGELANITNSNNIEIALVYQFGKSNEVTKTLSKSETSAIENRLKEVVRQQEIKDSVYEKTLDSLNTEINIKQLENKVLADENILVKNNTITTTEDKSSVDEQARANKSNNGSSDSKGNNANTSKGDVNGTNIKVNQTNTYRAPVEDIQTQSIKIKDDFFTEVLNEDEAPDGYYVVTGMYASKAEADRLLKIALTKFSSAKMLVNKRNNKYYVVLFYSENINGVIEALIKSNSIKEPGFSKAWALNYFKNR